MTEADFILALDANPTDKVLRGAYADWLESEGRTKDAEFQRSRRVLSARYLVPYGFFINLMDRNGNLISGGAVKICLVSGVAKVWDITPFAYPKQIKKHFPAPITAVARFDSWAPLHVLQNHFARKFRRFKFIRQPTAKEKWEQCNLQPRINTSQPR
jgi:uncharacterized protein (TIGR02996 family)